MYSIEIILFSRLLNNCHITMMMWKWKWTFGLAKACKKKNQRLIFTATSFQSHDSLLNSIFRSIDKPNVSWELLNANRVCVFRFLFSYWPYPFVGFWGQILRKWSEHKKKWGAKGFPLWQTCYLVVLAGVIKWLVWKIVNLFSLLSSKA